MTKYEIDELLTLQFAGVPEIPAPVGKNTPVWIDAIAKVITVTGRESLAIVRQREYGKPPVIRKTFNDDGVAKVVSLHPYKFLDGGFVPKMEDAAATKRYIAAAYGVPLEKVTGLKKDELKALFYTHCIKMQLENEKNQTDPNE